LSCSPHGRGVVARLEASTAPPGSDSPITVPCQSLCTYWSGFALPGTRAFTSRDHFPSGSGWSARVQYSFSVPAVSTCASGSAPSQSTSVVLLVSVRWCRRPSGR
jgi:hypothetical protein